MKNWIIVFILLNSIQTLYGLDIDFNVSGTLGIVYNVNNNKLMAQGNVCILNWTERNLNIGFNVNLLNLEFAPNTNMEYSFLPIEIYYTPLKFGKIFHATIYGRSEWRFQNSDNIDGVNPFSKETENYFLGTLGGKLSIIPNPNIWEDVSRYYRPDFSLFFEYNTSNQFRIGLSIDILGWVMLWMHGIIIIP